MSEDKTGVVGRCPECGSAEVRATYAAIPYRCTLCGVYFAKEASE
jgi:uncharacterized protein (DUF983 family)